LINDPWEINETGEILQDKYPGKEYRRIAAFLKSNSDLSYIWLIINSDADVLVEHSGQKTGKDANGTDYSKIPRAKYFEQGAIARADDSSSSFGNGQGTKVFLLPKPSAGKYSFSFSGNPGEKLDFDLHVFTKKGGNDFSDIQTTLNSSGIANYTLTYSFEDQDNLVFEKDEPKKDDQATEETSSGSDSDSSSSVNNSSSPVSGSTNKKTVLGKNVDSDSILGKAATFFEQVLGEKDSQENEENDKIELEKNRVG